MLNPSEDAFIEEIESSLKEDAQSNIFEETSSPEEDLPNQPFRFSLHFLDYFNWPLLGMASCVPGEAACQILIPKAVQRLIDAISAMTDLSQSLWTALASPMRFFILLNIGILLFSRTSGTLTVIVGPALRRRVRKSVYRYLQGHSQRYFMGNFAGSLANRIAEVSMGVNFSLWTVMFDFWPVMVTLSVSLIVLAQVHTGLAFVLASWSVGYITISYVLAMRCRHYAKQS